MQFIEDILKAVLKHQTCPDGIRRFRIARISVSHAKCVTAFHLFVDFAKASNMETKIDFANNTIDANYVCSDGIKAELHVCFIPVSKQEDINKLQGVDISDYINESSSITSNVLEMMLKAKCRYRSYRS